MVEKCHDVFKNRLLQMCEKSSACVKALIKHMLSSVKIRYRQYKNRNKIYRFVQTKIIAIIMLYEKKKNLTCYYMCRKLSICTNHTITCQMRL